MPDTAYSGHIPTPRAWKIESTNGQPNKWAIPISIDGKKYCGFVGGTNQKARVIESGLAWFEVLAANHLPRQNVIETREIELSDLAGGWRVIEPGPDLEGRPQSNG